MHLYLCRCPKYKSVIIIQGDLTQDIHSRMLAGLEQEAKMVGMVGNCSHGCPCNGHKKWHSCQLEESRAQSIDKDPQEPYRHTR